MKKKFIDTKRWALTVLCATALIATLSSTCVGEPDNGTKMTSEPPDYIYIAFGQSNMEGYLPSTGYSGTEWVGDNGFDTPPNNFLVMAAANDGKNPYNRRKGEWYKAVPPLNQVGDGLSPADFFGRTVAEAVADQGIRVGVIIVAVSGCQIVLFSKNQDVFKTYIRGQAGWMQTKANAYVDSDVTITSADFNTEDYPYKRLVDLARKAQEKGVIKGIIMHQGESGGNLTGKTYAQTVRQIYNDLCKDLELDPRSVPFFAGQAVGNNNSNISSIPNAFKDIPNTAFVIPSNGCTAWNPSSSDSNDKIHFSFDGYKELGKRYGQKMLELLGD